GRDRHAPEADAHDQDDRQRREARGGENHGAPTRRQTEPDDGSGGGRIGARGHDQPPDGAADGRAISGWIAATSRRSPSTSRGPGRVTTMSSIGLIAWALTAVTDDQPGRFATAAAVTP